jgi:hypothetical protein
MKKLLILIAIVMGMMGGAYAQDAHKDGYMMKDGKVWQVKKGKKTQVTTDATLLNGTIVSPIGNVTLPDGTIRTMKNGETLYTDGTWSSMLNKDNMRKDAEPEKSNIHKDDMPK